MKHLLRFFHLSFPCCFFHHDDALKKYFSSLVNIHSELFSLSDIWRINFYILFICNKIIKKKLKEHVEWRREFDFTIVKWGKKKKKVEMRVGMRQQRKDARDTRTKRTKKSLRRESRYKNYYYNHHQLNINIVVVALLLNKTDQLRNKLSSVSWLDSM